MTVQAATARVSFVCNGVSTVFPVNIQAYAATDFLVLVTNAAGSITLNLNSDYTLVPSGSLTPPFWSLTTQTGQLASPYATGNTLQVILNPVQTQLSQYTQGQAFPSLAVQTNLDRLTQMVIRQTDQQSRSIDVPDGDVNPVMTLPVAALRASKNLGFDSSGNVALNTQLASGTISTATLAPFLGLSQTTAEAAAGVVPSNLAYQTTDVRRYGALGNNVQDDGPAINQLLLVLSQSTGTGAMKVGYMPKPPVSYLINTVITNQPGISLDYNGEDISASGTQFTTLPLYQQISIEGTPPNNYKSAVAYAQDVAANNGSLGAPFRYWTIIGSVNIPSGATVAGGVVTNDHVGVRGQAVNNANNTRIWGVVGVAVAKQPGAGLNDTQMGSIIGGEFDVNNLTGTNIVGYDRNLNYVAVQAAMGGTNNCMAAYNVQVGGSGQFIAGVVFKGNSLAQYGLYFDNVAPSIAGINFSDAYTGGGAISIKNGLDALFLRNAASNDFVGRVRADTAAMQFVGGAGAGVGTPGIYFSNHANNIVNAILTDLGCLQGLVIAHKAVAKANNTTTIPVSPGGQFTCSDSSPTTVTAFTGGELGGRKLTMLFTTANTTISTTAAFLKGGVNANPSVHSTMTFEMDGSGAWWETGRSF